MTNDLVWPVQFDYDFLGEGRLTPSSAGGVTTDTWQAVLGNTYVLGPSAVNEFRVAANYFHNLLAGPYANKENVGKQFGIPGLPDISPAAWGVPVLVSPGSAATRNQILLSRSTRTSCNGQRFADAGAHTLKFGSEIRRDRYNQGGNLRAHGTFSFDGRAP